MFSCSDTSPYEAALTQFTNTGVFVLFGTDVHGVSDS
jgi:hypothetical protein